MGRYTGKTCRLSSMLLLTTTYFLVEIIVGYVTNSMALVADSFHMLSDVIALVIGLFSVRISKKKTAKNTFGWARAEVLGALVNAVFLLALCFSILVESIKRIAVPEGIEKPVLLITVGTVGLIINLVGLVILGSHGHSHGGGSHGHSHGGGGSHSHDHEEPEDSHGHSHGPKGHGHSLNKNGTSNFSDLQTITPIAYDMYSSKHAPKNGLEECLENLPDEKLPFTSTHDDNNLLTPLNPPQHADVTVAVRDSSQELTERKKPKASSSAQMNMRGVILHVLGDALGSVVVIISAVIMWQLEGQPWTLYVDPAMSIFLTAIILSTTVPLLKESALILLQTVPTHIEVEKIKERLLDKIEGVMAVHEFHVWQLAGNRIIASAHIHCRNLSEYTRIAEEVKEFFHNEGIHSTTIQPEFLEESEKSSMADCILECKPAQCGPSMCCGAKGTLKTITAIDMDGSTPNVIRHRGHSHNASDAYHFPSDARHAAGDFEADAASEGDASACSCSHHH